MQVAAGNIDQDAGDKGDSQEVTALKFKAIENQVRFLRCWTSLQECACACHSNIHYPVIRFGVAHRLYLDVKNPPFCTRGSWSRMRICTSYAYVDTRAICVRSSSGE